MALEFALSDDVRSQDVATVLGQNAFSQDSTPLLFLVTMPESFVHDQGLFPAQLPLEKSPGSSCKRTGSNSTTGLDQVVFSQHSLRIVRLAPLGILNPSLSW
eukprot:m.565870 g.565870  ORF g.565870 m.565870 type:complete len:102 (-) comp57830_c0_seq5:22-327(-)